jgi:MOSC domain-containing protein YiiM
MLNPNSSLSALLAAPIQPGRVTWIGVRPERGAPLIPLDSVMAEAGKGLVGDRYKTKSNGARQVSLIAAESLAAIASFMRRAEVEPALLRRNIVVQGMNLHALKNKRFRIGEAVLEYSGECHPCSRMEENLGTGGYNAVRGHGGITARILESGRIACRDAVQVVAMTETEKESG